MEDSNALERDQRAINLLGDVLAAVAGLSTATLTDAAGGAMVGAAAITPMKAGLERLFGIRGRQITAMCEFAAQAAHQSVDELLEQVTADPHRAQLFAAAVRAAGNTALESKLKVLGRLLVQDRLSDERVDEARLLTETIEDVERLHLRILDQLRKNYSESLTNEQRSTVYVNEHAPQAWTFDKLTEALGVSSSVLEVAIGSLYGNNLVVGSC
jgi:DNA-binding transcriptional ArsR family regulator